MVIIIPFLMDNLIDVQLQSLVSIIRSFCLIRFSSESNEPSGINSWTLNIALYV